MAGARRTFVFTDIEGSTRMWETHAALMTDALARHDALTKQIIDRNCGEFIKHMGDGLLAVFDDAGDALTAATQIQRDLAAVAPNDVEPLRVRIGVHCGEAIQVGADFYGPTLNRCARLVAVAHGGQVVTSDAVLDAIGGDPDAHRLRDLGTHQLRDVLVPVQVFQLDADGLEVDFPPLRTVGTSQHNLPGPVSTFVGRVKMLERVDQLIHAHRLVTIVGAGGCGKTRLAVEAAAARVARHVDGAWLVELAAVATGDDVASAISLSLRMQNDSERPIADVLCARLERSDMLLVLDNCEHVIDQVAPLGARLLRTCPNLRLLATSREPLGIPGEALFETTPLDVPLEADAADASTEAVQLFIDRALLVQPDFSPVEADLAAVGRVCQRLEGIPLAIELAAARLNVLSVRQLESRLDRRFALLTGTGRRSERHRTLAATVEWSFDLLDEPQQRAWAALSVFVGGFDLQAAAFVLALDELDALDVLSALVNRSIVRSVRDSDGDLRFQMLETMREFGSDQLNRGGELGAARSRHRAWALDLAAQAEPEHMTDDGPRWHTRFERDYPNFRRAIESGLDDGVPVESLRLCADLGLFFWLRGHLADGLEWTRRALAAASHADDGLRARGLLCVGELAFGQVDLDIAVAALEEAVAVARTVDDDLTIGWSCHFLGVVYAQRGDVERARAVTSEGERIAQYAVSPSVRAGSYYWLGAAAATLGDEQDAAKYLEAAVTLSREAGSPYTLARVLPLIARRLYAAGDHETAFATFAEAVRLARSVADPFGLARCLHYLAEYHIERGAYDHAAAALDEAEPIVTREIDDPTLACRVELTSATLWRHRGEAARARSHFDRATAWVDQLQAWRPAIDPYIVQAELRVDSGDAAGALEALATCKDFARQSNHRERVGRALVLEARVLAELGRADEAAHSVEQAEQVLGSSDDPVVVARLALAQGVVARCRGQPGAAIELLRSAVAAATSAEAALLTIECLEDLALALSMTDDGVDDAGALVEAATRERSRIGAPRPDHRAVELARLRVAS